MPFDFVELKDNKSDLGDATEQVVSTYRSLKKKLKLTNNYTVQAFLIGHHGSAPIRHAKDQNKLKKEFKNNYIYNGKLGEFADFLRGLKSDASSSRKMKRKKKKDAKVKNAIRWETPEKIKDDTLGF